MVRFVALVWSSEQGRATAEAQRLADRLRSLPLDWHCALKSDGLLLFLKNTGTSATETYRLQGNAGLVIGKLFNRSTSVEQVPVDVMFDEGTSRTLIESRGKLLSEDYWGRYVAFIWDAPRRRHYVFRDPTGALPCVFTEIAGVFVFMSNLQDLASLHTKELCTNWGHIAAQFWNMRAITRDTGFVGVSQVYAGECMVVQAAVPEGLFHWNPCRVYESGLIEDAEHAQEALRQAISTCIRAWASCYGDIILELSGGLDSSIVAGCLGSVSNAGQVVCVNFRPESQEGDERYFAGLAADRAGFELIEVQLRSADMSLEDLLDTRNHATPSMTTMYSAIDKLVHCLAQERGTEAVFTGQGGDHLFQQARDPRIAAEYAWLHGLHPGLAAVVGDTSRLTGQSLWKILGQTITYGLIRRRYDPYNIYERSPLLTDDAVALLSRNSITHPWVETAGSLPASKLQHIELIVDTQPFYVKPSKHVDIVHPLISQPVIECCLKIPTYVLTRRGVSRGLAREAFKDKVPSEIVARISKGSTTNYFTRLLIENATFLREYLLDSLLVSSGILDKQRLEDQLSEHCLVRDCRRTDIYTALRVETWLRSWASVWPKTVA